MLGFEHNIKLSNKQAFSTYEPQVSTGKMLYKQILMYILYNI